MAGPNFPPNTSASVASRSRSEGARDLPKTSQDREGLPPREGVPPAVFTLTKLLLLFMIGLGVVAIVILLWRGPAWP